MRHTVRILAATVLALLAYSPTASADLRLILKNGAASVTVTSITDVVTFNGAVGGWTINITSGVSNTGTSFLNLNSIDKAGSSAPNALTLVLSGNDFLVHGTALSHIGGTLGNNGEKVTYQGYYDPSNVLASSASGPFGTAIGPSFSYTRPNSLHSSFSNDAFGPVSHAGTFTEVVTFSGATKNSPVSFGALIQATQVPEPGPVTLLGAFLLGSWGILRWRSRTA